MTKDELAEATANTYTEFDVTVSRVVNGYIVQGTTRYLDTYTSMERAKLVHNNVAEAVYDAVELAAKYLEYGKF